MAPKKLIFFEEDVTRTVQALEPYQKVTRTRANVLVDADGNALAQTGTPEIPPETIGALVAASVGATRHITTILAPDEFITLTHPGKAANIQLTAIAEGAVLVTVFDAKTTVGAIVFYLKDVVAKLSAIVKDVATRKDKPVDLGAGFGDQAQGALDDLLGS